MQVVPTLELPDAPAIAGLCFRYPRLPDDWTPIAELATACQLADGVEEVSTAASLAADWGNLVDFAPERDMLLAEIDGRVVGLAAGRPRLRDGAMALESWCKVHPDVRRRGLGTALHHWIRRRLAERAARDPRPGPRQFRGWALDAELGDVALFHQEGFVPIRSGFEMRRPLTGRLPDLALPRGLAMRPVRDEDIRAILIAEDEAFRDHWGHADMTEDDVRSTLSNPDLDTGLWCVAWDGEEVAGVVQNTIFRTENEVLGLARGWLERVSVRRPWRGKGVAKALVAASLRVLRDHGMDEAWLGVDASNPTGALQLYEGLGFVVSKRWAAYGRPLEGPAPSGWDGTADSKS